MAALTGPVVRLGRIEPSTICSPGNACNSKVGADDGARVRSHPAGSDRMVVRESGVLDERQSRVLAS